MPKRPQTETTGPIWTLDGRDSVLLGLVRSYFKFTSTEMGREIKLAHEKTKEILSEKGIGYDSLRTALEPQADKFEFAFVFDSARIDSASYGYAVADWLIPLLDRKHSCSFLAGDLIHPDQKIALGLLQESVELHQPCEIRDTSQLYCVYINNLSKARFQKIHSGLLPHEGYIGFIDATFSSRTKDFLSFTLVRSYLKTEEIFLCVHEDDVPNEENYNTVGWPVAEHGYNYASLQSMYFNLFLSYKIERALYPGFEDDTEFAVATISGSSDDFRDFEVVIEKSKLDYLGGEKSGVLKRLGLTGVSQEKLATLVKAKADQNYIYNLRYTHDASLFNIMTEIQAPDTGQWYRVMVALEYKPRERQLRLVTLY